MMVNKENIISKSEHKHKHKHVLSVQPVSGNDFGLFPSESQAGVTFTREERLDLSRQYSNLYRLYTEYISEKIANEYNISELASKILVRRAVVPMLHCYLERLIRINKFIKHVGTNVSLPHIARCLPFKFIEDFQNSAVSDPVFNQSLINDIAQIWQLSEDAEKVEYFEVPSVLNFKNHLVQFYPRSKWRILKKIKLKILASLPFSRFPTISLSNDYNVFFENNFYFRYFGRINLDWSIGPIEKKQKLRNELFSYSKNSNFYNEFMLFLSQQGLASNQQDQALELFKKYMVDYYPISLLESIPENISHAEIAFKPFKKRILFCSGAGDTNSTFIIAFAKQSGMKIIKRQHGGYYGYLEDVSSISELEYSDADVFLSWGWKHSPCSPVNENMFVKDLPSPWLSERKKYWRSYSLEKERKYDVLFMPNMVKRFPHAPHGASTSRIELIYEYIDIIKTVVEAITSNSLSVLHKPYNTTTVKILEKTLNELEKNGGEKYTCVNQLDKGLTYDLINKCHVVLWDYPGTGFLECVASKIPTMIYWTRVYAVEEECAEDIFIELEKQGVVHTTIDSLINEIRNYKKSPHDWMNNIKRLKVVNKFCREFAWASDDWVEHWRQYLGELEKECSIIYE